MERMTNRLISFVVALFWFGLIFTALTCFVAGLIAFVAWKPFVVRWGILRLSLALAAVFALLFACSEEAADL